MKIVAYLIMLASILGLITTEIILDNTTGNFQISDEMFKSSKGIKAIVAFLKVDDSAIRVQAITYSSFVFLFALGCAMLLLERLKRAERRIKTLENKIKN